MHIRVGEQLITIFRKLNNQIRGAALLEASIVSAIFFPTFFYVFQAIQLAHYGDIATSIASCAARLSAVESPDDGLAPDRPNERDLRLGPNAYLRTWRNYTWFEYCRSNGASITACAAGSSPTYERQELKAFNLCLGQASQMLPSFKTYQARNETSWRSIDEMLASDPFQFWLVPEVNLSAASDTNRGYYIRAHNKIPDNHPSGVSLTVRDEDEPRAYTFCIGIKMFGKNRVCRTASMKR